MFSGSVQGLTRDITVRQTFGPCMTQQRSSELSAKAESIYRDQGRELWALFYAQCCDAERAHDALQEAFLRLYQQNGTPIRDVRAWLLQVGRNWLRDVARRQRVAARPAEHLDSLAGPPEEASSIAENKEYHSQIRKCLSQLKIEDREVLVLRYSMGWSSRRIASVLNSTTSAVDMRLSRARRRLAELIKKKVPDRE